MLRGAKSSGPRPSVGEMSRIAVAAVVIAALALGGGKVVGALRGSSTRVLKVVRIVDGDTIVVSSGGTTEKVRYIGVDTPEDVKPGTPVQCFSRAAAAFNRRLVLGQRVRLVADAESHDRYGRSLFYVYRSSDGLFVNAELVKRGYARTLTIPPNVAHAAEFGRLASSARRAGRGLWSRC
jgi:micrococcal nuclease